MNSLILSQEFIPAVVTPVRDGMLDTQAYRAFLTWLKDAGVKKVVILGSTGEGVGLFPADFQKAVEVASGTGLELIVSVANPNPYKAIEIIKSIESFNLAGVMLATPFTTKSSQADMVSYFKQIGVAVSTPLVIYNNPARFGLKLDSASYKEILSSVNICGVKECANPDDVLWGDLRDMTIGTHTKLYAGDDENWLSLNVDGLISVIGNVFPKLGVSLAAGERTGQVEDVLLSSAIESKNAALDQLWCQLCGISGTAINPLPIKHLLNKLELMTQETFLAFNPLSQDAAQAISSIIANAVKN